MRVRIRGKIMVLLGYRAGGKSTLAHYIASHFGEKCLLFDTLKEVSTRAPFHTYKPTDARSEQELGLITRLVMDKHQYQVFIIDEANRHCPPKPARLPQAVADLNDWCRHAPWRMGAIFIARRPTQLHSDLVELADNVVVFNLAGKNDVRYLNDLASGMGDTVKELPDYHFVVAPNKRSDYRVCTPIDIGKLHLNPRRPDDDPSSSNVET